MNINTKILDLIHSSIKFECGDGDALWLSKHTSLDDLITLIEEYDKSNNTGWKITKYDNHIIWGIDQEWAIITNDVDFYNSQPKWIILKINY